MDKVIWVYIDLRDMRLKEAWNFTEKLKESFNEVDEDDQIIDRKYLYYVRMYRLEILLMILTILISN